MKIKIDQSFRKRISSFLVIWIVLQSLFILIFPVLKLYSFHSHYWDLGLFDHFLYVFQEEGNYFWFLKNHFSPVLFFYGLLYSLWPSPYLLVLLQSGTVILTGWLLYLLAIRLLRDRFTALLIAWVYFLHPMVLYQAFWDFHTDHLFMLFVLLFFWIELSGYRLKKVLLIVILLAIASIKESGILLSLFLSLYLFFKREYSISLIGILGSLILFWFVSNVIG
ncbi:MAG: hypothetical protein C6I05_05905, partial [Epsilonproteobacteria bacterium]|nr:hypothetical protein [Campylobacterota bacterium]